MTVTGDDRVVPDRSRAVSAEHTVGEPTAVTISDPLNARVWIQATDPVRIEP